MTAEPKLGDLKVWWIPQVPGKPFEVPVATIDEAKKLLDVLAKYDAFQFEQKVKPDYSNVGGLMIFEDGEWTDWSDDVGESIDETDTSPLPPDENLDVIALARKVIKSSTRRPVYEGHLLATEVLRLKGLAR
jgi:hypothetical protein